MKQITLLALTVVFGGASLFAADPQLLNLAVPDAQMYAGVNVTQARNSQFGQFLLAQFPESSDFDKFTTLTGFDPRKDLSEILITTASAPNQATPSATGLPAVTPINGLFLAKGTFNIPQILTAAATDPKVTTPIYAGVQLVTINEGGHAPTVGLLDSNTVVAGDIAAVKAAIDRRNASNVIDAALLARINALSGSEDAWSVSTGAFASMLPIPGVGSSGSAVLQGITQASAGVKFDSSNSTLVQVNAQAVAKDATDATSLSDVVKLLSQMVAMHTQNGAASPLAALLQGLAVTTDGNVVNVSLNVPVDQLESIVKHAGERKTEITGSKI